MDGFHMFTVSPTWGQVMALQVWQQPCPDCGRAHIEGLLGYINLDQWPAFTGRSPSPVHQMLMWPYP